MLHLNLRNGDSTIRFGGAQWSVADGEALSPGAVQVRLQRKRVAVLVSGYNVADPIDAYDRIARNMGGWYDEYILVSWPNSCRKWAFWWAQGRANKAGRELAAALHAAGINDAAMVDIEGHSLGCRVTLAALAAGLKVDTFILAGAAVDNEALEDGEEFGDAIQHARRAGLIAYSGRDDVLLCAYTLARWDCALGLTGPENPKRVAPHVRAVDLTRVIAGHSDYKKCKEFYEEWRAASDPRPAAECMMQHERSERNNGIR